MSINDGGPAFPMTGEGFGNPHYSQHGMTLRDWFAGQALAGLMMKDPWGDPTMLASYAFNAADAMLAARAAIAKATGQ